MKILTLNNGTEYEFSDDSHITHLTKEVETFGDVDAMVANITEETLNGATFDGETLENMLPGSCSAETNVNGVIFATFVVRPKTETELMKEEITELQEAIAEIAGEME